MAARLSGFATSITIGEDVTSIFAHDSVTSVLCSLGMTLTPPQLEAHCKLLGIITGNGLGTLRRVTARMHSRDENEASDAAFDLGPKQD